MNKTFKIIVKLGTLSLPSGAVVFFGGGRLRQPRDGTMLDETPVKDSNYPPGLGNAVVMPVLLNTVIQRHFHVHVGIR